MPTLFTPQFNNFQKINATQAWSLFFTISKDKGLLGSDASIGRYITLALFGAIVAGIVEISFL